MGAITPAIGTILALGWLGTLAIPNAWHSDYEEAQLVHTYLGIFTFKLEESTLGQGLQLGANLIGGAGVGEKLKDVMATGSYWIWEAKEKYCAQDALGQVAQELVPFLKEQCNMWTRISIASYVILACVAVGSCFLIVGSFLSANKGNLSKASSNIRKVGLIFGPVHGILGLGIYFFMTMDFPGNGSNRMTLGAGFWAAAAIGLLSFLPFVISQFCEPNNSSQASKGKIDSEQDHLMHGQQGGKGGKDYMAVGMSQQPPQGKGVAIGQAPNQQWQSPSGQPPNQQWQSYGGGQPMQQYGGNQSAQHYGSPENPAVPQEAWDVIARAAGQPWIPPPVSPRGASQFPHSAPGNPFASQPHTPMGGRPQMPLSWGCVPYTPGQQSIPGLEKSHPDFRPG